MNRPLVMKFGGTSVADAAALRRLIDHVRTAKQSGARPVVVVSALGGVTNELLRAAVAPIKAPREQLHAFIRTYLQLVHDEPTAVEVLTIELRQSSKFMKEYENPQFADFLRLLGGIIAAAQDKGELDRSIPAHVAARMIFGVLDELALAWVLGKQPFGAAGARPKKFDIVRAADWVITLVTSGLTPRHVASRLNQESP